MPTDPSSPATVVSHPALPAQSTMGKAISYTLAQRESLQFYLSEPKIEINNNVVGNATGQPLLEKELPVMPMPVGAA